MRKLYRCITDKNGTVRMVECKCGEIPSRLDFDVWNNGTMSEKVLKGYYALECEKGSRFSSGYSKDKIKSVHENRIAECRK